MSKFPTIGLDVNLYDKLKSAKFIPLPAIEKVEIAWQLTKKVDIGVITKVELDSQKFEVSGTKANIEINAFQDDGNDSKTYLSLHKLEEDQLQSLIGKEITNIVSEYHDVKGYDIDEKYSSDPRDIALHTFEISDGRRFDILSEHIHNGYYCGGSTVNVYQTIPSDQLKNNNTRCVIVLGLPASGKTTFCRNNFPSDQYHLLDDPLYSDWEFNDSTFFSVGIRELLGNGQHIVINDPRMCREYDFKFIYDIVMEYIIDPSQVCIIYYDNDPEGCMKNIHRDNLQNDIKNFAEYYNDTIEYINSLSNITKHRVSVYNKDQEK